MSAAAPPPFPAKRPAQLSLELGIRENICFLHPGYHTLNLLLTLPRVDRTILADATPTYGVHHRTALLACQIIAGNAFHNSFLALDRAGQQPVQVLLDGVLTDTQYYFIVNGSDWQFPHDHIPDFWPTTASSSSLTTTCAITNENFAIDGAHLIPQKERDWYDNNEMSRYGSDPSDINNEANILRLRKDIHHCFDNRWFVVVPKIVQVENESTDPSIQYVTHVISPSTAGFWPRYHNTLIEPIDSLSRPYLFARFACAILLKVKLFVIKACSRYVIRVHKGIEGEIKYEAEHCTGKMLNALYGGGGSQAANSKRKSDQMSTKNDEEISLDSSSEDSNIGIDMTDDVWDIMDDWNQRGGRTRSERQESSGETAPDTKVHLVLDFEADRKGDAALGHIEAVGSSILGGPLGDGDDIA